MDALRDSRINCVSVLTTMSINDYLELVKKAYRERGGIEGQRDALKSSTAIRIRERLIEDLIRGAVIPPIVSGVIVDSEELNEIEKLTTDDFHKMISDINPDNITIIDGMQRTTALIKACESGASEARKIRVEFWIAENTKSLIYRMLVLNSGQVPWDLRRQVEVVFSAMVQEMRTAVPNIELLKLDDQRRRGGAGGQFQADRIIELFLVFGARKATVDTKERLADEFIRLDFIEATGKEEFVGKFYQSVDLLGRIDKEFSRYKPEVGMGERFNLGKDLFSSQPACIGFVLAISRHVLGRPGFDLPLEQQQQRWEGLIAGAERLVAKLHSMNEGEIGQFLDFITLNEAISKRAGKVGEFERDFFLKAFLALIEDDFSFPSMTPCWRAY
ncbi:MAG: hypothetical protein KQJ78_22750 [Deltaproteobacteria bacterium]|nr:hypothetical protein [Deltaproteobacteria bacterium]